MQTKEPELFTPARRFPNLSGLILAGGMSMRMGVDKAFLTFMGRTFVATVTEELSRISDDVVVAVGGKPVGAFAQVLPAHVSLVPDSLHVSNPIGGVISGLERARHEYAAVVACDLPLLKSELLTHLYKSAEGHSAAVPMWENGDIEPLCSVYRVSEAKQAGAKAIGEGRIGPRYMISYLRDTKYVNVSELRTFDPELGSFMNINTSEDYESLRSVESARRAD